MYIYPLLKDKTLEELIKVFHYFGFEVSEHDAKYIHYCIHAWDERNYLFLRDYLKEMVDKYEKLITSVINGLFPWNLDIRIIYDIGAGHDGYAKILHKIFPNAEIVLIDKYPIKIDSSFHVIQMDIFDENYSLKEGPDTVIWMSEFLHCKKANEKILKSSLIRNSHVFINEVCDKVIGYRLEQSGGQLFKFSSEYRLSKYDMHFKYTMGYKEPNNVKL
jgi:hypothetical protein